VTDTIIPSNSSEPPHAHEKVREAVLVLEGRLTVAEIVGTGGTEYELAAGDFVVFDPRSCHTMANRSEAPARTLTFKFVGEEKDEQVFVLDKLQDCTGPLRAGTTDSLDPRFMPYVRVYNNR
jgi:uncharacterized cupin superfamily protein